MHTSSNLPHILAQSRNTVLTSDQIRILLDTTAKQPKYCDLHDTARIMLRSEIRPAKLERLRWSDFQFGVRVMRVVDRNTGLTRGTILDRETVAVLQQRRDRGEGTEYVMGEFPRRALARATRQYRMLSKELDLPDGGLHLFRRTARVSASECRRERSSSPCRPLAASI